MHLNAQAKEYNNSPSDTFWETHGIVQLAAMEGRWKPPLLRDCCALQGFLSEFHEPLFRSLSLSLSAVKVLPQQILPAQYEDVVGDNLINLAVVLEDMATDERVLASEEFNIAAPQLSIQVL